MTRMQKMNVIAKISCYS